MMRETVKPRIRGVRCPMVERKVGISVMAPIEPVSNLEKSQYCIGLRTDRRGIMYPLRTPPKETRTEATT